MLRHLGIRSKILAVLALPVLVLVLAASVIAAGAVSDARRASQVETLTRQAAGLSELVRRLQAERYLTIAVLTGEEGLRPRLEEVRTQVSGGVDELRLASDSVDFSRLDGSSGQAYDASQTAHDGLASVRAQVDGGVMTPLAVQQAYSAVIDADVALPAAVADGIEDRRLAVAMRAFTATEELGEALAIERDAVTGILAGGGLTAENQASAEALTVRADVVREQTTEESALAGIRTPAVNYELGLQRVGLYSRSGPVTVTSWRAAVDSDIEALGTGQESLAQAAASRATQLTQDATRYAWQVAAAALLLVVVPVVLALLLARRITRPLRRLTEAAAQMREELPVMVERMQTPGEGPGTTVPEIPVESGDEIGRLAAAFNDVNTTTVQVAQEQAALRGSIAAMFVNVARRDQKLLSRQLSLIDQLERTEENPGTLENLFTLDHLATRMRRNAESLLVLAGIDTGRRLRRPMPLADVVRTASSEIEYYERIDLSQRIDPPVLGHAALPVAHLLAELLENATSFSDPASRVVVSTETGPRGVVVTIADDGLGMSDEEVVQANERIANPPVAEAVGAERLGFFVVGRLARKLDVTVSLEAGRARGLLVRVEMPPALFVPGSVVEVVAVAPDGAAPDLVADLAAADLAAAGSTSRGPAAPRGGFFSHLRSRKAISTAGTRTEAPDPDAQTPVGPVRPPKAPPAAVDTPVPVAVDRASPALTVAPSSRLLPASAPVSAPGAAPNRAPAAPKDGGSRRPELAPRSPRGTGTELPPPVDRPVVPATRPAAPVPPEPEPEPVVGASAMDILPGSARHRSGSKGRLRSRHKDVEAPRPVASPLVTERPAPAAEVTSPFAPAPPAALPVPAASVQFAPPASSSAGPDLPGSPSGEPQDTSRTSGPQVRDRDEAPAQGSVQDPAEEPAKASAPPRPSRPRTPFSGATRATPPQPAPALPTRATALPSRQPVEPSGPRVAPPIGDPLRQRSALASEALTELSRLSSYRPDTVAGSAPVTLTRRTPAATPAAVVPAPQPVAPARRNRSATDVRSMLSGFQAGVQRGRTSEPSDGTGAVQPAEPTQPPAAVTE